ncbi:hypothetical protein JFL43_12905 [Viridibacillus sp. YIM B01967]|uniref:LPS export ABC transporter periplasmic protein LptC n=1 Tax=Viridibacillus soli TaxID=2798301 RepID=A0ABS1H8J2_9BACL|nr:hypothetical protein [Viridibacillus soli]MBK3495737.1 hypothetical protein [Viridibacillus soli]
MKNIISIVFIAIILIAWYFIILNSNEFVVENEPTKIEEGLNKFINRPEGNLKVKLLKIQQIVKTDTFVAVFSINEGEVGYAKLEKKLFNKLKIIHTGHGSAKIKYEDIETNKGNYGLLYGTNPQLVIHTVQINNLEGTHTQDVDISNEEIILVADKLPKEVDKAITSELIFFDKKGNKVIK